MLGQEDEAIQTRKWIDTNLSYSKNFTKFFLGKQLVKKGNYKEALAKFDECLIPTLPYEQNLVEMAQKEIDALLKAHPEIEANYQRKEVERMWTIASEIFPNRYWAGNIYLQPTAERKESQATTVFEGQAGTQAAAIDHYLVLQKTKDNKRSYVLLQFDLGWLKVPPKAEVSTARLMLSQPEHYPPLWRQDNLKPGESIAVTAHQIIEPWKDEEVDWFNCPKFKPDPEDTAKVSAEQETAGWEIGELVKAWLSGDKPNYGLLLQIAPEEKLNRTVCFINETMMPIQKKLSDSPLIFAEVIPRLAIEYNLPRDK